MKKVLITFPDGKVYSVNMEYLNNKYIQQQMEDNGFPLREIPPIDSGLVGIPAWIRKHLSWAELSEVAEEYKELTQNEKNTLNFKSADIKVLEY